MSCSKWETLDKVSKKAGIGHTSSHSPHMSDVDGFGSGPQVSAQKRGANLGHRLHSA